MPLRLFGVDICFKFDAVLVPQHSAHAFLSRDGGFPFHCDALCGARGWCLVFDLESQAYEGVNTVREYVDWCP